MNVKVREYLDSDFDEVNKLLMESFSISKGRFRADSFYEIVAEYEGVVCGYLLLTKVENPILSRCYYLVDYVCVSSLHRGKGIADVMLNYADEIARNNNALYLQLTCGYQRVSAHRLYEKCGYVKRDSDIFRKVIS